MSELRNHIKNAVDRKVSDPIACPEWDATLYVRVLSGGERDEFESSLLVSKGKKKELSLLNIRAKLVRLAACDEKGEPVFLPGDEVWLAAKSSLPLNRLFEVAQRLNGITEEDVEELVGNSGPGLNAGSGSS